MVQPLSYLKESASQTAGPYVHIGTNPNWVEITGVYDKDLGLVLVSDATQGERIVIEGRILDGVGAPLRDALVEIWQADSRGFYNSPNETRGTADTSFPGWGRQPVDGETGVYRFETIRPGSVPYPDGRPQAPHITVWIVARGINIGLHTRLYFADEAEANAKDPLLLRVDNPERRKTLVAPFKERAGLKHFTFDIMLQGDGETVFLDM